MIHLFLKPSKISVFLPLVLLVMVVLTGFFTDITHMSSFISGISTGIYASLFWFVSIQNARNNGPFMNQTLVFSLPLHRKELIKPWFIANQLSFFLIFLGITAGIFIGDVIDNTETEDPSTYLYMLILALVCCILFNLQTPLSFFPTIKKSIILSVLLFCFGLIVIPISQVLLTKVFDAMLFRLLYILFVTILYCYTTYWAYKKSLHLIDKIE